MRWHFVSTFYPIGKERNKREGISSRGRDVVSKQKVGNQGPRSGTVRSGSGVFSEKSGIVGVGKMSVRLFDLENSGSPSVGELRLGEQTA